MHAHKRLNSLTHTPAHTCAHIAPAEFIRMRISIIVSTFNIIAYLKTCNAFCKTVFYPKVDVQLFANKIGNAYKKKTSPNLSSGKNQIKNKFSNSKKGVRPLTTLETKLKEKYADRLFQEVERVHTERIPLNEVKLGDKVRGRIINIEE